MGLNTRLGIRNRKRKIKSLKGALKMPGKIAWSFLCLLLAGCLPLAAQNNQNNLAANTTAVTREAPSTSAAHPLQIATGDLLDVNVFDTPELSAKVRVDDHGAITLPLGGALPVSGLTAEQAGLAIEERLRRSAILKDPHVSVTVLEYTTQGVTVLGEVKNPGVYPLLGTHGLLDLISTAGGVTPNAGKSVTVTHRTDPNHPLIVDVDGRGGNTVASNVDIRPGDTIMVSRAGIVYVLGDVGKPGGFVIGNGDRLTVLQAVSLAQGANRTAALNRARLIRKTDAGRQELPVQLAKILADKAPDQPLSDGDILFVPSSGAKNAMRTMETVLPAAAGAAIYR
jgi:polysaccharide export outer membrane protein